MVLARITSTWSVCLEVGTIRNQLVVVVVVVGLAADEAVLVCVPGPHHDLPRDGTGWLAFMDPSIAIRPGLAHRMEIAARLDQERKLLGTGCLPFPYLLGTCESKHLHEQAVARSVVAT